MDQGPRLVHGGSAGHALALAESLSCLTQHTLSWQGGRLDAFILISLALGTSSSPLDALRTHHWHQKPELRGSEGVL
jgi:hypothetical protein